MGLRKALSVFRKETREWFTSYWRYKVFVSAVTVMLSYVGASIVRAILGQGILAISMVVLYGLLLGPVMLAFYFMLLSFGGEIRY